VTAAPAHREEQATIGAMDLRAIPLLRIFDEDKAKDFYLGFLAMQLDWEHRFEPGAPRYMQVSREGLVLHLSEHSGDCSPGAKVFVVTPELDRLHREITARGYRHCRPEIGLAPRGERCFEVVDPFSNRPRSSPPAGR